MDDALRVLPGRLHGTVAAPPSKSVAHRALICAWLAGDIGCVRGVDRTTSRDIASTIDCLAALGKHQPGSFQERRFHGGLQEPVALECGESGSTLRFLVPLVAALGRFLGLAHVVFQRLHVGRVPALAGQAGHFPAQDQASLGQVGWADRAQAVQVGQGLGHRVAGYHTAGARLVVDQDRLPERFTEFLRHRARRQIRNAAGAEWHDDAQRLGRKSLCHRGGRQHQHDTAQHEEPDCLVHFL